MFGKWFKVPWIDAGPGQDTRQGVRFISRFMVTTFLPMVMLALNPTVLGQTIPASSSHILSF